MNEIIDVKKQLKVSLPMAFENFINILMTLIDTIVIATLGTNELGAIGAMNVVLNIMNMSIQSINISNIALLSKSNGENNKKRINLQTGNSIILSIIISLITILIVMLINPIFPQLFNVDKICITYISIRLIGFIQSSIITILTGHQRTMGKQQNIMILRIIATILNLLLDLLVVNLGYGVTGVAWVTVIIDTVLCIYLFLQTNYEIKYKIKKEILIQIFNLFKWNCMERIVSRIDTLVFNILVSRIGPLEYAVHVIVIQIRDISQAFIQGFSDGISITIGIETSSKIKDRIQSAKIAIRKVINIMSIIVPTLTTIIAIVIAYISLKENNLMKIFYYVLPLLLIGQYEEISGTYYYGILRGLREFKFLAKRNFITSMIKILIATILSYTILGIIGVWIAYTIYCFVQKHLSKYKYKRIEKFGEIL